MSVKMNYLDLPLHPSVERGRAASIEERDPRGGHLANFA